MDYHNDNAKSVLKKNGKSFHWAGKFLPKQCINRAAELYNFCRILDDIADNGEKNSNVDTFLSFTYCYVILYNVWGTIEKGVIRWRL